MIIDARTMGFFSDNSWEKVMRKLWFVAVVMMVLILLPSAFAVSSPAEDSQPIDTSQPAEDYLPRVYAENIARDIYNSFNLTKYKNLVIDFSENGSRYIYTYAEIPNSVNQRAQRWLTQQLSTLSNNRLEITLEGQFKNILAVLPGYLPSSEELPFFLLTAHYDSLAQSPGANTDGGGIAVLLELVRVMSQYEWPLDIQFLIFNGEHAMGSNLGSKEMSNGYALDTREIYAMYNVDTILYQNRFAPTDERVILAYNTGAERWAYLAKTMGNFYGGDIVNMISSADFTRWSLSGHYQFSEKGIQNVLFAYESGYMYDDISGSELDTWNRREYNYFVGKEVAAFIGSSLAFVMGRGYGYRNQFFDVRTVEQGSYTVFYLPITTSTTINITCRWYGGGANFILLDNDDLLVNSVLHTSASAWEPSPVMNQAVSTPGLYKLIINNPGEDSIGVDIYIDFDSDMDQNGILDSQEYWLNTALFYSDADNDTISDAMEIIQGLDINSPDSDHDAMPDAWELKVGLNPRDPFDAFGDPDHDNLTNLQEYNYGLNPYSADSDMDGMIDSWEIENGLNPLVNDANENPDNDQYTNYEEFLHGTDPNISDEKPQQLDLSWAVAPSAIILLIVAIVYINRRYAM